MYDNFQKDEGFSKGFEFLMGWSVSLKSQNVYHLDSLLSIGKQGSKITYYTCAQILRRHLKGACLQLTPFPCFNACRTLATTDHNITKFDILQHHNATFCKLNEHPLHCLCNLGKYLPEASLSPYIPYFMHHRKWALWRFLTASSQGVRLGKPKENLLSIYAVTRAI